MNFPFSSTNFHSTKHKYIVQNMSLSCHQCQNSCRVVTQKKPLEHHEYPRLSSQKYVCLNYAQNWYDTEEADARLLFYHWQVQLLSNSKYFHHCNGTLTPEALEMKDLNFLIYVVFFLGLGTTHWHFNICEKWNTLHQVTSHLCNKHLSELVQIVLYRKPSRRNKFMNKWQMSSR